MWSSPEIRYHVWNASQEQKRREEEVKKLNEVDHICCGSYFDDNFLPFLLVSFSERSSVLRSNCLR